MVIFSLPFKNFKNLRRKINHCHGSIFPLKKKKKNSWICFKFTELKRKWREENIFFPLAICMRHKAGVFTISICMKRSFLDVFKTHTQAAICCYRQTTVSALLNINLISFLPLSWPSKSTLRRLLRKKRIGDILASIIFKVAPSHLASRFLLSRTFHLILISRRLLRNPESTVL